jgi:hypothetical protein
MYGLAVNLTISLSGHLSNIDEIRVLSCISMLQKHTDLDWFAVRSMSCRDLEWKWKPILATLVKPDFGCSMRLWKPLDSSTQ